MRTGLLANRYDAEVADPTNRRGNSPTQFRGNSPTQFRGNSPTQMMRGPAGDSPGRLSPQAASRAAAGHHATHYQPQAVAGGAWVTPNRKASPPSYTPASPRGRPLQYQQYPGSRN